MSMIRRIFFISLLMFSPLLAGDVNSPSYRYNLSICAIFRDDARFLKEWIEFHRLVGVDHFYLFNNLSEDDYLAVLKPYIKKGIVELIQWPFESIKYSWWNSIQVKAYAKGLELARKKTKWLAIIDTDEFLTPVSGNNLIELLKPYEKYGGVCVNWQNYGTSNIQRIAEDSLMIGQLLMKAPKDSEGNHVVKSIVRPERVVTCKNPHFVQYTPPYYAVTENQEKMVGIKSPFVSISQLRLNHYWARDEDFFYQVKIPREEKFDRDLDYCLKKKEEINQVYDDMMLRFVSELQKILEIGKKVKA